MDRIMEKMRRVMIGTPTYDGSIQAWYVNSLVNTFKLSVNSNIEIFPIWVSYDALIQRARNDTFALAREMNVDDLIFIDADIDWEPEWFFKLLNYPVDVVGGTYPKKGELEMYVVKMNSLTYNRDPITNLIEVDGLGTGFLRLSKKAIDDLWTISKPYEEKDQNKVRRWVFDVVIENDTLISEDIVVCNKLKELGYKIWLDPSITCGHSGFKHYTGNFKNWLDKLQFSQQKIKSLYE